MKESSLVIVFSPPLLQGISSLFLSYVFGKKIIFHVEDVQPDSAVDLGMLKGKRTQRFLIKWLGWIEKEIYKSSYKVSTLTEGMRENISGKIRAGDTQIILFPYWVDSNKFMKDGLFKNRFRRKMKFGEDILVIGYAGNIGRKQRIEHLLEIAKSPDLDERIIFVIAGEGADKNDLISRKERIGIRNLVFMNLLQGQDYIDFLNGVDLSYISQDAEADKIFIPSKIFKTLSCGSPILCVAAKNSELAHLILNAQAGFVMGFDEIQKTICLLNELRNDREILDKIGGQGVKFARKNFGREGIMGRFLQDAEIRA